MMKGCGRDSFFKKNIEIAASMAPKRRSKGEEPTAKRQRTAEEKTATDALTGDASTWVGMPLTSVEQVSPAGLKLVMDYADKCKAICEDGQGSCELLKGKIMAAIFYEASTRTNCSFQAAMLRF